MQDAMEQDGLMPASQRQRMSEAASQQAAFGVPDTPGGSRQSLQTGSGGDGGMSLPAIDTPSVGGQALGGEPGPSKYAPIQD